MLSLPLKEGFFPSSPSHEARQSDPSALSLSQRFLASLIFPIESQVFKVKKPK